MPGMLWANESGTVYSPLLAKEVEIQAQPDMRFVQFCETKAEWGKNAGETFLYDRIANIDTQGGKLTETATIPEHKYTISQGTATLYEFGNSIPWTRKYDELAQINIREAPVRTLGNDYAKVIDTAAEDEFNNARYRYVATHTASQGYWSTSGTNTATCSSALNTFHVKCIIDYMYQTMLCKPYSGDDFMCIASTNAKRGVYDDCEDILQYTQYPATGEFGRYYDCRFVRTNHALDNSIGTSDVGGEAYFFGGNGGPVARGIAVKMEIRQKEPGDFGRSKGLAWYSIEGWDLVWKNNPDANVVKYTTTGDNITR